MDEKDYLKKWKDTNEYANAKSWHEIFMADADEYSKQLKDKERNESKMDKDEKRIKKLREDLQELIAESNHKFSKMTYKHPLKGRKLINKIKYSNE